ncbi:hypothetical protein ACUXE5_002265 [Staphylococcus epidermidis]
MLKSYYKFNFATEPEKPTHNEYDPQLEKERESFLKQLEVDWEE